MDYFLLFILYNINNIYIWRWWFVAFYCMFTLIAHCSCCLARWLEQLVAAEVAQAPIRHPRTWPRKPKLRNGAIETEGVQGCWRQHAHTNWSREYHKITCADRVSQSRAATFTRPESGCFQSWLVLAKDNVHSRSYIDVVTIRSNSHMLSCIHIDIVMLIFDLYTHLILFVCYTMLYYIYIYCYTIFIYILRTVTFHS